MPEFHETVLKLQEGHTWKCKPGYKIFVLEQGALRFDVPEDWVMELGETSVKFYDRQPPDDNCRLEVSLLRHPQIDWSQLPLDQLLRHLGYGRSCKGNRKQDVQRESRPGIDLVWVEEVFTDPNESKPARSRIALVRGTSSHALVTLDFWEADAERVLPAWDGVMRSIDMRLKVLDPTRGEPRM
jgi:hypothetical protein